MAGEGYNVTKSISAETEAIRKITAEIQKLKARKNADTTAIRSWRFKYMAWKNRTEIVDKKQTEDQVKRIENTIRAYNRSINNLEKIHQNSIKADSNITTLDRWTTTAEDRLKRVRALGLNTVESILSVVESDIGVVDNAIELMKKEKKQYQKQIAAYEDYLVLLDKYSGEIDSYEEGERIAKQVEADNAAKTEDYQLELKKYQEQDKRYKAYQSALKDFENKMDDYNIRKGELQGDIEELEETAKSLNETDYGVKLAVVDTENLKIRPTSEGANTLAAAVVASYRNFQDRLGLERYFEGNLFSALGNPDFSEAIAAANGGDLDGAQREIARVVNLALQKHLNDINNFEIFVEDREGFANNPLVKPKEPEPVSRPVEPEKPKLRPVEHNKKPMKPENVDRPKEIEPIEVPSFAGKMIDYKPVALDDFADKKLVEELSGYATGSYSNTRGHFEEINGLAEKIGVGCPKIMIVSTNYASRGLVSALNELESALAMFGAQKNSQTGATIVRSFRTASNELKAASNFDEFEAASQRFDILSTRLIAWISSNWWQFGGKPSGNAHPWKPTGKIRKLSSGRK